MNGNKVGVEVMRVIPPSSTGETMAQNEGFFAKVSAKVNEFLAKINLSKDRILDVLIYGGIGFLSGFLFKKFSRYVIVVLLTLGGIFALNYLGIIQIFVDWDKMNSFLGIQQVAVPNGNMFSLLFEWVKVNVLITISFVVGFLLGMKLG